MGQSKIKCYLPNVTTAGIIMEYFGMSESEFELIVTSKGLPVFRTEYNRYYNTDSIIWAIQEFITESMEFDSMLPTQPFPIFVEKYKTMFQMTKPRERQHLRDIQSVYATFGGEFADYAKSVVFDWQHDLCDITQKRFLAVMQRLEWLTETGEMRLKCLEEKYQE